MILGFNSYAELSLTSKMAKSPGNVWDMINELSLKAKPKAQQELATLKVTCDDFLVTFLKVFVCVPTWGEKPLVKSNQE